jgi:predicted dehydrogenase
VERVRIGVVGAGSWSTLAHLPALCKHPGAVVAGLADADPRRLAATADRFGIAHRHADHRALIEAGELDGLVIATPHATHYAIASDALAAGLHLLVEKPLTVQGADARELHARARTAGLHLLVGHTYHFQPSSRAVRAALLEGAVGELRLVSCLFASSVEDMLRGTPQQEAQYELGGPNPETYSDPALAGGGQGLTQGSHALEMVLWATGLRARRVSALMASHGAQVDLVDAMSYELESGVLGTFATTGGLSREQERQQEIRYYGTRGVVVQDLFHARATLHPADGPPRELAPAPSCDDAYPLHAPARALVDAIRDGEESPIAADTAVAAAELLEAAYASAARGGAPVDVTGAGSRP